MGRCPIAAHWKPAKRRGEDVEQQQRHHELRGGHAHEGEHHHEAVHEAVALERGEDAEQQPERDLDHDAGHHQDQGRGDTRSNEGRDLASLDVGASQVAPQQTAEITPELLGDRQIEPELMAHVADHLSAGAAACDQGGRIGRQEMQQQERDERDPEQDRDRLDQSLRQEPRHQPRPRCVGSKMSRKASPSRLKERAVARMMAPGMKTSQGALWK